MAKILIGSFRIVGALSAVILLIVGALISAVILLNSYYCTYKFWGWGGLAILFFLHLAAWICYIIAAAIAKITKI